MRLAHGLVVATSLLIVAASLTVATADEPKHGGILKIYHRDSPPSASIHEEATYSTVIPFMPIF
jgi:peptide/nickel transport system substrate-binding protein